MIDKINVIIPGLDNYPLSAIILKPAGMNEIKGVIQFHNAIAVKKEFYLEFCKHLAEQNYIVVMHDNRGVGGSRPEYLKGFRAYLREWGELDMPGVMEWIAERYPDYPKYIVAHSMGGQIIGLMRNYQHVNGIIAIASSIGYWNNFKFPINFFCFCIWFMYEPVVTRLFGYAPGKKIGIGEDLPKEVAREWGNWCRHKMYLSSYFGKTIIKHYYNDIKVPFKFMYVEDDEYANPHAVKGLADYYVNAAVEIERIELAELNIKRVGHFGYFSPKFKNNIWNKVVVWLDKLGNEALIKKNTSIYRS